MLCNLSFICTDSPCKALEEEEAQSEETTKLSGSRPDEASVTSAQYTSQISDVAPITEDDARSGEEFMQSDEEKKRENNTQTGNSPTARSSPDTAPDTGNRTEDTRSNGNNTASLSASPQLFSPSVTGTDTG